MDSFTHAPSSTVFLTKLIRLSAVAVHVFAVMAETSSFAQIPAFPGAEGAGAFATGGRPNALYGGMVYHVTNLEPDPAGTIPGSLRYGLKNENFWVNPPSWPLPGFFDINNPESFEVPPRIIVFDVGGVIDLSESGDVDIAPMNITLAGQTAPGGITLYGAEFNPGSKTQWTDPLFSEASHKTGNMILRNFAVRTHDQAEKDGLWLPATNSIADHISLSWYTDEGLSITDAAFDVTVQHSIIGPGWNVVGDGDGSQLEGSTPMADISIHHNLYIHNDARIPRLGEKEGPGVEVDFRNNVVYNWDASEAGYSVNGEPHFTNFVNNYYIGGADNDGNDNIFSSAGALARIYQSGNLLDRNFNGTADGADLGWAPFTGFESQQSSPISIPHGVTQTPEEALDTIINYAGANWWDRHELDERAIDQLQTYGQGSVAQTGEVLTGSEINANDLASVTNLPIQNRPAGWDTDNDGMPNFWEVKRGLNPAVADWDSDDDNDGYVNLEEYINELAAWPAPDEIVFNNGNSRFAEINNWSITRPNPGESPTTTHWQPSRFDVAVINSGTVVVDAPGQVAGTVRLGSSPGDTATLNITDGWLEIKDESVGPGEGTLIVGADPAASAAVNLSGGKLMVKTLTKGAGGSFHFSGGTLSAETIEFDLVNDGGTIDPGSSPGVTEILGDLTINAGSLSIEIGGTDPGNSFDQLQILGSATLAGTLHVSLLDDFEILAGTLFEILNITGTRSGEFEGLSEGSLVGNFGEDLFITYLAGDGNDVALFTQAAQSGDFDSDGDTDGSDFLAWQQNPSVGSFADWQATYGTLRPFATGTAVPEPSTALLLLAILLSGCAVRKSPIVHSTRFHCECNGLKIAN